MGLGLLILELLLSCNAQDILSNRLPGTTLDTDIESLISGLDDKGNPIALEGYSENKEIKTGPTLDFRTTPTDDVSTQKIFEFKEPDGYNAEFSEPISISGSFLALRSNFGDCEQKSYRPGEPSVADILRYTVKNNICDQVVINFCIRLTSKASTGKVAYLKTPAMKMQLLCADESFAGVELSIEGGASTTSRSKVDLQISAGTSITQMYITNSSSCKSGGTWESYASSSPWTLAQTNATANVYVKFKDTAGNESSCISASIVHDNLAPAAISIAINSGATYTNTSAISLSLAATGASDSYITNTAGCASGGTWENYVSSSAWTLAQTNATATVFVKFKDAAGNESACISDSIIHDNLPPNGESISINSGASYTSSSSVTLTLAATGGSDMYVTNTAGCGSGGTWESYAASKSAWVLGQSNTSTTVYVKFRDTALNESSCASDAIVHDDTAPTSTSISIDAGASTTTSTSVTLTLAASGASQMYITNIAGCASGGSWVTYASSSAWTLAQTNASATVYVKFRDAAGNESSCILDTITHGTPQALSKPMLAAGEFHNCVLGVDGGVRCWGDGLYGKLGNNSNASMTTPTTVNANLGANKTAVRIAVGWHHTCAILNDGSLKCWGRSDYGQLGQDSTATVGNGAGTTIAALAPINLGSNKTAVAVTAGYQHTCAILNDGNVKCWGRNHFGQLGLDSTTAAGNGTGTAMASLPTVNLGTNKTALQIAANANHTCALLNDYQVKCWGDNTNGQLGTGDYTNAGDGVGTSMASLPSINLGSNKTALSIATGPDSSCAILNNHSLKCWSGTASVAAASPLNLGSNKSALAVAAGYYSTCAVLNDGTAKCWGGNGYGQLGQDHTSSVATSSIASLPPINLGTEKTALQLAVGLYQVCGLLNDGTVKCWGSDGGLGLLGQGTVSARAGDGLGTAMAALPALTLGNSTEPVKIAAGAYHSCALLGNGAVKCWGENSDGQLGLDSTTLAGNDTGTSMGSLPTVNLGSNKTAIQIAGGLRHSCALLNDGTVKCWGLNDLGQLGQDNTTNVANGSGTAMAALTAINLGTNKTAVQIATGDRFSCAILNDGSAKCWGDNSHGQLGQDSTLPVGNGSGTAMAALPAINLGSNKTAVRIASGSHHTCALLNDGASKCWGLNSDGQLGHDSVTNAGDGSGTAMSSLAASFVGANKSVVDISAGSQHTCGRLNEGSVKCWGRNASGQLGQDSSTHAGDGSGTAMAALTAINLGSNKTALQVAAGYGHSCALLNDGSMKCWGEADSGQLGQDSTTRYGDSAGTTMAGLAAINLGTNRTAIQISAGHYHSCAIVNNGSVKCWGQNSSGQLGQGHITNVGDGSGTPMSSLSKISWLH